MKNFLPLADKMSGAAGKTAFATKGQTNKQKIETLWKFSQVCKDALGGKRVDAGAGQSKKQVTFEIWTSGWRRSFRLVDRV